MASVYGQPDGEYEPRGSVWFLYSHRIPMRYQCGWKLHVSVNADSADQLARVVLPTLRVISAYHKVVTSIDHYGRLNQGGQKGKFITVYAGPPGEAQRIVNILEPALVRLIASGAMHGPIVLARKSEHTEAEVRVGCTGMISTYWSDDFQRD